MPTANSFNVQTLFQKVFGITGVRFAIPDAAQVNSVAQTIAATGAYAAGQVVNQAFNANAGIPAGYSSIPTIAPPTVKVTQSALGTPIYEQIRLSADADTKRNLKAVDYIFPGWPLFDITGQNIIISTQITGQKGSVKEYITQDDYAITIRGFLINDNSDDYPEVQLNALMQVLNRKTAFTITSAVFNNCLDIGSIVINKWNFPEVEGYPNIQPFEIDCTSDDVSDSITSSIKGGL